MDAMGGGGGLNVFGRSLSMPSFARAVPLVFPVRRADFFLRGGGLRGAALRRGDGPLVDVFLFPSGRRLLVVIVPSSGPTASLLIGRSIVNTAAEGLGLR